MTLPEPLEPLTEAQRSLMVGHGLTIGVTDPAAAHVARLACRGDEARLIALMALCACDGPSGWPVAAWDDDTFVAVAAVSAEVTIGAVSDFRRVGGARQFARFRSALYAGEAVPRGHVATVLDLVGYPTVGAAGHLGATAVRVHVAGIEHRLAIATGELVRDWVTVADERVAELQAELERWR